VAKILVVDDDRATVDCYSDVLRWSRFDVVSANTGIAGFGRFMATNPDAIFSDLRLPDMSGIDLLRAVRHESRSIPFVIVTEFATWATAVEAMKLGATDYMEKPLSGEQVIRVVADAIQASRGQRSARSEHTEAHAAIRWVRAILPLLDADGDPRTIATWSRHIGVSSGALKAWCRLVHVSPKCSLNLARLLRALIRHRHFGFPLEQSLDISDERTLSALLNAARVSYAVPPQTLEIFLHNQTFVRDSFALAQLKQHVKNRW
jgi:FixJ family two-component response regulator